MNPAFVLIVLILCIALWVILRKTFTPVGRKATKIGKEIQDEVNRRELDVTVTMGESEEKTWREKDLSDQ